MRSSCMTGSVFLARGTKVKGQVFLGSEAFMERLTPQLQECATAEIPKCQRLEHRPSLKTLLAGTDSRPTRNEAMARAYLKHGYTLTEIGRAVGLHYATISRGVGDDIMVQDVPVLVDSCLTLQCTGPARKAAKASNFER